MDEITTPEATTPEEASTEQTAVDANATDAPVAPAQEQTPAEPVAEAKPEAEEAPVAAEPTSSDFGKMLEEGGALPGRPPKTGEKVKCSVVSMSEDKVFVSFGGKSEGFLNKAEFKTGEEDGEDDRPLLPAEGDEVEAYVLATRGGEVQLSTRLTRRDQSRAAVEDAFIAGVPVEGRVVKVIKGGFEVRVSGLRAFCPLSQIDVRWPKEPEVHVGNIYTFKVSEYKEKGRNIIVSRRSILEEQRVTQKEELKKKIKVGSVVTGNVRNVQKFGAFVELGGIDGLIPVSEMGWDRVDDPSTVVSEGQQVSAKVIGADWDKERISLSLKALQADPWAEAAAKFEAGSRVVGKVVRLAEFGAFVNLAEGVDGMIHISALGVDERVNHPREVLTVGDEVDAEILKVDMDKRRISLSLDYKLTEGLGEPPKVREMVTGVVEKLNDYGVFLKLPSGHTAMLPRMEINTRRGEDHKKLFTPGDEVEAEVIEVGQKGRRIKVSLKAASRTKERAERKEFEQYKGDDSVSMGTLGDLLKKMKK